MIEPVYIKKTAREVKKGDYILLECGYGGATFKDELCEVVEVNHQLIHPVWKTDGEILSFQVRENKSQEPWWTVWFCGDDKVSTV
jgi:predicted ferric reductase